jgi:hypothetical protein
VPPSSRCKRDLNAFGQGACGDGLGLEHDVVEALGVHLLPDLDQVAVGALHQAVEHFHHVQARAQRAVDGAHLQADDAATQDQHALGDFLERQGTCAVHHARVFGHEGQAHGLAAGSDDGLLERDDLLRAGLFLAAAGGFSAWLDGISIEALSDSTVIRLCSALMVSPGLTSNSMTATSEKSPMSGSRYRPSWSGRARHAACKAWLRRRPGSAPRTSGRVTVATSGPCRASAT